MITVRFEIDSDAVYKGFSVSGHADFADSGQDIVCAAVSALTLNTINAIETFTEDPISYEVDEGYLAFQFDSQVSDESRLLMNTLVLGLEGIRSSYGTEFLNIQTEEV